MSSWSIEHAHPEVLLEMPQMGVSVAEGTIAVWHKRVGDWVEADEVICEITTDKIDIDVPSPVAGRVVELMVAQDETVPIGTPLARIATHAAAGEAHQAEHEAAAPAERDDTPAGNCEADSSRLEGRPSYSPVVQRIAAEHGIDLDSVGGSGRRGRVRKQDVLAVLAERAAGSGPAPQIGASAQIEGATLSTDAPQPSTQPQPLSRMRRAIAEHMTRSLQTAAHCTTIIEADFSRVEGDRARLRCSPLPIVARAAVEALKRHPGLNATLDGELLTRHHYVNLGIAVSLDEQGLIVPVIHRAQELSVEGLAVRIRELALRARTGTLTPDDVRGGTFTITNPGSFGSIASTPIINQPQVAILDLEAVVKRPVAVTVSDGIDAVTVRPIANLCLSWDHRALDGALAAQFLATLRVLLEGNG